MSLLNVFSVFVERDPLSESLIRVYCEEGFPVDSEALKTIPMLNVLTCKIKIDNVFIVFAIYYIFNESHYAMHRCVLNKVLSLDFVHCCIF